MRYDPDIHHRRVIPCPPWDIENTAYAPDIRTALEENRMLILEMRDVSGNLAAADPHAAQGPQHGALRAVGELAALLDAHDHADRAEEAVALGHGDELVADRPVVHRLAGLVAVGGDGDDHVGEDDAVGEREEGQGAGLGGSHGASPFGLLASQ